MGTRENNEVGTYLFAGKRVTWRKGACTLIELLVVMSLMALLSSILLPALQQGGRGLATLDESIQGILMCDHQLSLGRTHSQHLWSGLIDDVRIYDGAVES